MPTTITITDLNTTAASNSCSVPCNGSLDVTGTVSGGTSPYAVDAYLIDSAGARISGPPVAVNGIGTLIWTVTINVTAPKTVDVIARATDNASPASSDGDVVVLVQLTVPPPPPSPPRKRKAKKRPKR